MRRYWRSHAATDSLRMSSHGAASISRSQIQSRVQSSPLRRLRVVAISTEIMLDYAFAVVPLIPSSVVGSYPQPDWLVDRTMLGSRLPPRTRAMEIWRVEKEHLEAAQDDATLIAIRDLESAGIDIITDGEIRRESYSNRFATALEGMDLDNPGTALDRTGHANPVPRIVGPIRRRRPVMVRDITLLRANTDRPIKATVPGPFTMSQQAQNDYYPDRAAAALDYAAAVNLELRELRAAGAD